MLPHPGPGALPAIYKSSPEESQGFLLHFEHSVIDYLGPGGLQRVEALLSQGEMANEGEGGETEGK